MRGTDRKRRNKKGGTLKVKMNESNVRIIKKKRKGHMQIERAIAFESQQGEGGTHNEDE